MIHDDNSRHATRCMGFLALMLLGGAPAASAHAEAGSDAPGIPQTAGQPLDEFDRLELHYRRYSAAAHQMTELVQQLDRKIQEVSLAARAVESKGSSHNKRMLEEKLRQLENARTVASRQHGQLRIQMQNEYRSLAAAGNGLKARYAPGKARDAGGAGAMADEPDPGASVVDPHLRDSQIIDLDAAELRVRRDGIPAPDLSPAPSPVQDR
jgi:hypothetical protein